MTESASWWLPSDCAVHTTQFGKTVWRVTLWRPNSYRIPEFVASTLIVPSQIIREKLLEFGSDNGQLHTPPTAPYDVNIKDADDAWVLAAAVNADTDILVTGDKGLRAIDGDIPELEILLPREFIHRFGGKTTEELG